MVARAASKEGRNLEKVGFDIYVEWGQYSKLEDLDFNFTIKSVSKRELDLSLDFSKPVQVSKDFEERDNLVLDFYFADGQSKKTRR